MNSIQPTQNVSNVSATIIPENSTIVNTTTTVPTTVTSIPTSQPTPASTKIRETITPKSPSSVSPENTISSTSTSSSSSTTSSSSTSTSSSLPTATSYPPSTVTSKIYILDAQEGQIATPADSTIFNEIQAQTAPVTCVRIVGNNTPCSQSEVTQYYLQYINDPVQKSYLDNIVSSIQSKASNPDDQARIAISLVQNIPYDTSKADTVTSTTNVRYPYDVVYQNAGICEEKSFLLAYLLRGLGYGVVLFRFDTENHMAVGIKSPMGYSFQNSGYAFVETTEPTIPTDSQGNYAFGKLTSTADVFQISDGNTMSSISGEYADAQEFHQIYNQMAQMQSTYGSVMDQSHYSQWLSLDNQIMSIVNKYGLKVTVT